MTLRSRAAGRSTTRVTGRSTIRGRIRIIVVCLDVRIL